MPQEPHRETELHEAIRVVQDQLNGRQAALRERLENAPTTRSGEGRFSTSYNLSARCSRNQALASNRYTE